MTRGRRARQDLRRSLGVIAWPHHAAQDEGLVYDGPAGFVLAHGEWFDPAPLPADYRHRRGAPRACFGNAIAAAVLHGLDYVEGFALHPLNRKAWPIHHAWNAQGSRAVDFTWWPHPGVVYCGVRFSPRRADDATWNGDASILDDFLRRWPLLRQPWKGEPEGVEFPPPSLLYQSLEARAAGDLILSLKLWSDAIAAASAPPTAPGGILLPNE